MEKRVVLTLEYDMGDYSEQEEDGQQISTDPNDYKESLLQSDVLVCDMKIVGARIEVKP